jgi:phage FluMu gp28-like protein
MPYFLPYQQRWIDDPSPLKIIEKSRQIGITYADAYDSVIKAASRDNHLDVWVSSRDQGAALVYLNYCKRWARVLDIIAEDLGFQVLDSEKGIKARVLQFATGLRIHALSSSPDAIVGRPGHIKLDEFALHKNQRDLYRYAKPCTTWGGQISIISTHRGPNSVFNELIRDIKENGNPRGFSHHRVTLEDAVADGLVERINRVARRAETRQQFLARLRRECIDLEQWQQEYCCIPADEATAFILWEMIRTCESPGCILTDSTIQRLNALTNPLYAGVDLGRKKHLTVIDVGEKIGDVIWDRLRIELLDKKFAEIKDILFPILALPNLQRCCIDATGMGIQLAEETKDRFGWKIEPITFTAAIKETMAFNLRRAFEDRALRIDTDPNLHADLRGIKKEISTAGNIRFVGDTDDSHCDRFWAKALRQHAAREKPGTAGIAVVYDDDEPWGRYKWTPLGAFLRSKLK